MDDDNQASVPVRLDVLADVVAFLSDSYADVQQEEITAITERAAIRAARYRAQAAKIADLLVRGSAALETGRAAHDTFATSEPEDGADAETEESAEGEEVARA